MYFYIRFNPKPKKLKIFYKDKYIIYLICNFKFLMKFSILLNCHQFNNFKINLKIKSLCFYIYP